jgi:hypothetical protein
VCHARHVWGLGRFLHRVTRHKIDAVDNAFSCDLLYSDHRFSIRCGLRGEQVAFFESHRFSRMTTAVLHALQHAEQTIGNQMNKPQPESDCGLRCSAGNESLTFTSDQDVATMQNDRDAVTCRSSN